MRLKEERSRKVLAGKKFKKEAEFDENPQEKDANSTSILQGVKLASTAKGSSRGMKNKGFSLAMKFAFFISIVAASLCLVAELVVYFQIKDTLLKEIDRKGTALVRSVGSLAEQYYNQNEEYQELLLKAKGENKEEDIKKYQTKKQENVEKFSKYLENMVVMQDDASEILNITFLVNVVGLPVLQAGTHRASEIRGHEENLIVRSQGQWVESNIKMIQGEISTEKGKVGIRAYRLPLLEKKLEAFVMLSAQGIEDTTDAVLKNILITAVIAILLGTIISLFLARQVTQPVRQLMRDIEIISKGNLSHKTIPTSTDEIGLLAHTFNIMTQNLKSAHETELENKAREHEMKIATEIQSNLLPGQVPQIAGYDIASYYNPSKEVGGDYYDFIEIGPDHIGFIVADVSGKSIPGSMVMTMTRALIRMEALRNASPGKTFLEVNRILAKDITKGMFVTAMYCILEISTGNLILSSAGHNPAIVWKAKNQKNFLVNPKGMALGLDKGIIFEKTIREEKVVLERGDRVVLYTDGVPEAMSPQKEEFGDDRFLDIIARESRQSADHLVQSIVHDLVQWKGSGPQSDDITIVSFGRK
ncbi:MAG: SpoIIE family protein phosphatase [Candidatus Brocadiae bacterium]|nr:SpoIIE family protein phosphatase [Candidatus Brocadiia bacterium]